MKKYIGIDIGGTKCACVLAEADEEIKILKKESFRTEGTPTAVLERLGEVISDWTEGVTAIGISCGSPMDSRRGIILAPPNLPDWKEIHVTEYFENRFHIKTRLCNDANACALAEWRYGAGRGVDNMIFITCGTGLGAGLILNGRLYAGTSDMAGEIGHIRLKRSGIKAYGKVGSFEGSCSGSGIGKRGKLAYGSDFLPNGAEITAKTLAEAAKTDPIAQKVYTDVGRDLGRGLALLIDILNPQKIVIGGVFMRVGELLVPSMKKEIEKETLIYNRSCCEVVPAMLKEEIGDYSAVCVAMEEE